MRFLTFILAIVVTSVVLYFSISSKTQIPESEALKKTEEKIMSKEAEKPKVVLPKRNWEVLDPTLKAESALVVSLDKPIHYYRSNVAVPWPAASLTKLLTALIAKEDIGDRTKIKITKRAEQTEGVSGNVKAGEEYLVSDLLKIMLLASSNDAATAFEDHVSTTESFSKVIAEKSRKLKLQDSVFFDASGLNDLNTTTARDIEKLMRYIIEKHPDIIAATRLPEFIVQPLNGTDIKTITNINVLVKNNTFLGGKTGTSNAARQNLVAIVSHNNEKLLLVILGSSDRNKDLEQLLQWIDEAFIQM